MDFERWYRKTERKATARMWQGVVVVFVGMVTSGFLAKIGNDAGILLRPIFEVFAWVPLGLLAVAAALMASGAWTVWRLHSDPGALYERR